MQMQTHSGRLVIYYVLICSTSFGFLRGDRLDKVGYGNELFRCALMRIMKMIILARGNKIVLAAEREWN